jgi:hypothetical protein
VRLGNGQQPTQRSLSLFSRLSPHLSGSDFIIVFRGQARNASRIGRDSKREESSNGCELHGRGEQYMLDYVYRNEPESLRKVHRLRAPLIHECLWLLYDWV